MILRGLESAANGMNALINQNDSTANNVANVNTVGYKKQALAFKNIYDSNVVEKISIDEARDIGSLSVGSQVQQLTYDFSQGALDTTGEVFDVAIQGDGFFKIQSAKDESISYTRNGSFTLNNNGNLVTKDGDYVLDNRNKKIKINTDGVVMRSLKDIIINEDGRIELCNESTRISMQTIGIYDFSNKENMFCIGGAKFIPQDTQINPELKAEKFSIRQGALEMSNANIVNEMIKTISTSRNYESLSKIVKTSGDTLSNALRAARL